METAKRVAGGLVGGALGYFIGIFLGLRLAELFGMASYHSEAMFFAAFFVAPILFISGFIVGAKLVMSLQRRRDSRIARA
jgi:hypothetical protein